MKKKLACISISIIFVALAIYCVFCLKNAVDKNKLSQHLEAAQDYLQDANFENALAEYEQARKISSSDIKVIEGFTSYYDQLSNYYIDQQEWTQACTVLKEGVDSIGEQRLNRKYKWLQKRLEEIQSTTEEMGDENFENIDGENEVSINADTENEVLLKETYDTSELSRFITNYLKYNSSSYDCDNIDYSVVLEYVYNYVWDNIPDAIRTEDGGWECISYDLVQSISEQVYGISVPTENFGDVVYASGGFHFPAVGSGDWGEEYAIIVSADEEDDVYNVKYICAKYIGENALNTSELENVYSYTKDQILASEYFEADYVGNCMLYNDGSKLILKKNTREDVDPQNYGIDAIHCVEEQLPEISDLYGQIYYLSGGEASAGICVSGREKVYDYSGTLHDCKTVTVYENWSDRTVNLYTFGVDCNTSQVYWYDLENNVLEELDKWKDVAAYWFE